MVYIIVARKGVVFVFDNLFSTIGNLFGVGLAGIVKAILLFIIAVFIAKCVKKFISSAVFKLPFLKDKDNADEVAGFFGELGYLAILLLFVPGICAAIGASSIADPILSMLNKLWAFLPNVIGACIILSIGWRIAKLVKKILESCAVKTDFAFLKRNLNCEKECSKKLAEAVIYLIYVFILVPVFIAALQVLNLNSLTRPAVMMLENILKFVPNMLAFMFITAIGFVLARVFGKLVETTMAASGLDEKTNKFIGKKEGFVLSRLTGRIVHALVVIFFLVEALQALHMVVLSSIGRAIIGYLPNVIASLLVLLFAWMGAGAIERILSGNGMKCGAFIAKYAIYVLAGFMVLSQLSIAPHIVNTAFILFFLAFAIAFGIAFGLGGKDVVKKVLADKYELFAGCKEDCFCDEDFEFEPVEEEEEEDFQFDVIKNDEKKDE